MDNNKNKAFQLKIILSGSKPAIWRRIIAPSDFSFFDLHVAVQDAFGWEDEHLHQFFTEDPYARNRTSQFKNIALPIADMAGEIIDERKIKLGEYFREIKDFMFYEYDFGDSWMHEIRLEKILPVERGEKYPKLIDGERACPPEDCGGLGGYYYLLEILKNPKDKEHQDRLDWLGLENAAEFNAEYFDAAAVNFRDGKKILRQYEKQFDL